MEVALANQSTEGVPNFEIKKKKRPINSILLFIEKAVYYFFYALLGLVASISLMVIVVAAIPLLIIGVTRYYLGVLLEKCLSEKSNKEVLPQNKECNNTTATEESDNESLSLDCDQEKQEPYSKLRTAILLIPNILLGLSVVLILLPLLVALITLGMTFLSFCLSKKFISYLAQKRVNYFIKNLKLEPNEDPLIKLISVFQIISI
jgi:hypothetical protein